MATIETPPSEKFSLETFDWRCWIKSPWGKTSLFLLTVFLPVILSLIDERLWAWPKEWALPVTEFLRTTLGAFFDWLRPAGRGVADVFQLVLDGANWVLTQTHWIVVFGLFLALAWWIGRTAMTIFTALCLSFILLSGYWVESMNTLGLLVVSVPLAVTLGLVIGVAAYEIKAMRKAVETLLDVMQTIPTFAYLTPLLVLFGFGPVVGLIASAIYAAPPMARNVLLGLERIDPAIREAAHMAGASFWQRVVLVEIPSAGAQILVGVNQCVMAALSMVIIAAVIGGFNDIGWEVLLTMRKAEFGKALLAGFVIVVFAIMIDRMSARYATRLDRGNRMIAVGIVGSAIVLALAVSTLSLLPDAQDLGIMAPVAETVNTSLSSFTVAYGASLDSLKNTTMFYGLLPVRIGLDDAVLPFTWGFAWTTTYSIVYLGVLACLVGALLWYGRHTSGLLLLCIGLIFHTGVTNLPWLSVVSVVGLVGYFAGGARLALFVVSALLAILLAGLWDRAMLSVYLCGTAVVLCAMVGGGLGLLSAIYPMAWRILQPICDMLQTIPLFVFLIPMLMFFQIGEFSALLAICAYAIVPMIRYTRHGVSATPAPLMEAAVASGATDLQILRDVRLPYAVPTILLGLNQTILYAFAMLVIAALIGTTGLGQSIYIALGQGDIGLGIASGAAMALLALICDRIVQALAEERRKTLVA